MPEEEADLSEVDAEVEVERIVKRVLGKADGKIVEEALRCARKGHDARKFRASLEPYVGDAAKVAKIADRVLQLFQHRTGGVANGSDDAAPTVKKRRFDDAPAETAGTNEPQPDEQTVKDVMAQAQRFIEERKKAMNIPAQPAASTPKAVIKMTTPQGKLTPIQAQAFLNEALAKHDRAAELKARIGSKLPALLGYQSFEKQSGKPSPLILNAEGRTVDSGGREIQLTHRMPTLKANLRAQRSETMKHAAETATTGRAALPVKREEVVQGTAEPTVSRYLDPRIDEKSAVRKRRQFKFVEPGSQMRLAQRLRAKAKLDLLQSAISLAAKKTGISSTVKLAMATPKSLIDAFDDTSSIPSVEWWDSVILPGETYDVDYASVEFPTIGNLVEHPIQLRASNEAPDTPLKVYLTKHEQKKLRRMNRKEALKEKTEKIRLGLEAPPEPKVKIGNLMRVLGTQAVQDPTKMEAHVREQMARRLRRHEEANAARKLTPEARRAKKVKKMREDVSRGVHVAVYRVGELSSPAHKFKVEMNAKQLFLTGMVALHRDVNVVVVEGGPKQLRFFKRLMLGRIKWNEETKKEKKEREAAAAGGATGEKRENRCVLVWEGTVKERTFGELKFKACPLEKQARELFEKHHVEHYWDAAYGGAIIEQTEADYA